MHTEVQKFIQWLRCKSPHTSTHVHYGNDLKLFFAWANKPPSVITNVLTPALLIASAISCVYTLRKRL